MQHDHLTWNQNYLYHFLYFFFINLSQKTLADINICSKWCKHLMMNSCVQSFQKLIIFFLLFKLDVRWYICKVHNLAISFVNHQIIALEDNSFAILYNLSLIDWLHTVWLNLVCILLILQDLSQRNVILFFSLLYPFYVEI